MLFPHLSLIFAIIKNLTKFKTNRDLGNAIGVFADKPRAYSDSAVRNWLGDDVRGPGEVSAAAARAIVAFVQTLLPGEIPLGTVEELLKGDPGHFFHALRPVAKGAWSELLAGRLSPEPLATEILPPRPRPGFNFGNAEGLRPPSEWEMEPGSRYRFRLPAASTRKGEAILLTGRDGEWRPSRFPSGSRFEIISGHRPWLPSVGGDRLPRYFLNDGSTGTFDYVVAAADRIPPTALDALANAIPLDQFALDNLGAALLSIPNDRLVVAATTIRVAI